MATKWTIPTTSKATTVASTEIPDFFGTNSGGAFEVARAAKIPGMDPAIYEQATSVQGLRDSLTRGVADYSDALQKLMPTLLKANTEERSAVDSIYSPEGLQATLQGIRDRHTKAMEGVQDVLRSDLTKTLGFHRVGSSGTSGGGLNSFLTKIAAAEAGKLRAQSAADVSAMERADANTLLSARTSAAGQRQSLLTNLLQTILAPSQAEAAANTTGTNALANILQLALANSFSGLSTPR